MKSKTSRIDSPIGDQTESAAARQAMDALHSGDLLRAALLCKNGLSANPNDAGLWNIRGLSALKSQNGTEALECFESAIRHDSQNPVFLLNKGMAQEFLKDFQGALASYDAALSLKPSYTDALRRKANVLLAIGNKEEARALYAEAMEDAQGRFDLWHEYASFLIQCGDFEGAERAAITSIEITPSSGVFHNLGYARMMLGQFEKAALAYKSALQIEPDRLDTMWDLALCHERLKKYEYAIDALQQATTQNPKNASYWGLLGRVRREAGRVREAVTAIREALKLEPDNNNYWVGLSLCFGVAKDLDITNQLSLEIAECLKRQVVRSERIMPAVEMVMLSQPAIKAVMDEVAKPDFDLKKLQARADIGWGIFSHEMVCAALSGGTLCNILFEKLFTALRRDLLERLLAPSFTPPWPEYTAFYCALANQCFINEYILNETPEEREQLRALEEKLGRKDAHADPQYLVGIALVSCYKPLYKAAFAKSLSKDCPARADVRIATLLRMQLDEPLEELEIKKTIPSVTSMDDSISALVKAQYEENPYPRWLTTNIPRIASFYDYWLEVFPTQPAERRPPRDLQPSILIAGCGTGQQPIECAKLLHNGMLTSIDLSFSSLAYAIRKTVENGLSDRITYGQADILKLDEWEEQFDYVACSGVLHHMANPEAGLKVLIRRLKPGGIFLGGLYSELARQPVVAARKFIAERGY